MRIVNPKVNYLVEPFIDREPSICFRGEGFLTGMARNLAGCLLAVGKGELHPQDVKGILEARDKSVAPGILPPRGLILWDVHYDPKDLKL